MSLPHGFLLCGGSEAVWLFLTGRETAEPLFGGSEAVGSAFTGKEDFRLSTRLCKYSLANKRFASFLLSVKSSVFESRQEAECSVLSLIHIFKNLMNIGDSIIILDITGWYLPMMFWRMMSCSFLFKQSISKVLVQFSNGLHSGCVSTSTVLEPSNPTHCG